MQVASLPAAVTEVQLSEILMDTGIQCRAAIDTETVSGYAERMTESDKFPPVDLFGAAGRFWIGDGWHRIMAARQIGAITIEAQVHAGGRQDALKHALGANASHGHRRTNADKRRCVEIAITEFSALSSRAIAELCGVGDQLVLQVRESCTCSATAPPVTGADGKQYPAKRKPKDEAIKMEKKDLSRRGTPAAEKAEAIKALINTGHNIEQIADALSLSAANVRDLTIRFNLAKLERRGKRTAAIDSAHVIRETVNAVLATSQGLRLISRERTGLSAQEAADLLVDLRAAMKSLKTLEQLLKGLSQ